MHPLRSLTWYSFRGHAPVRPRRCHHGRQILVPLELFHVNESDARTGCGADSLIRGVPPEAVPCQRNPPRPATRLGVELQVLAFKRALYDYESAFADAVRAK